MEALDDPLFLRTAHGLKPTAHALQLKSQLSDILQSLYQVTYHHILLPPQGNVNFPLQWSKVPIKRYYLRI